MTAKFGKEADAAFAGVTGQGPKPSIGGGLHAGHNHPELSRIEVMPFEHEGQRFVAFGLGDEKEPVLVVGVDYRTALRLAADAILAAGAVAPTPEEFAQAAQTALTMLMTKLAERKNGK